MGLQQRKDVATAASTADNNKNMPRGDAFTAAFRWLSFAATL